MKYYTDSGMTTIYAEPTESIIAEHQLSEYISPVWNGKVLPEHDNIADVEVKQDGTLYEYYNSDGTPDTLKITETEQTAFRSERDKLLADTDYMMTVDYFNNGLSTAQQTELTNYRQALRDATDTWVMPTKPSFVGV